MITFGTMRTEGVERALRDFTLVTGRALADEVVAMARLAAVELARRTQPFGVAKNVQSDYQKKVDGDISRVFTTPSRVFGQLDVIDPSQASYFWSAHKAGDESAMMDIMTRNGIGVESIAAAPDPGVHRAARTKRGRVHKKYRARQLVTGESKLAAYSKKRQLRVGFAKAGWAKAADACGGHRGVMAWASNQQNSPGGATIDRDPFRPSVILQNDVTYVSEILPPGERDKAIADAFQNSQSRIARMLIAQARKSELAARAA